MIDKILTFTFPLLYLLYNLILFIQGITWTGVIKKHTGIDPLALPALLVIINIIIIFKARKGMQLSALYKNLLRFTESVIIFIVLAYLLALLLSPFVSGYFLENRILRWEQLTTFLGYIVLLNVVFLISNYDKKIKLKFDGDEIRFQGKAVAIRLPKSVFFYSSFILIFLLIFTNIGISFISAATSLLFATTATVLIYLTLVNGIKK